MKNMRGQLLVAVPDMQDAIFQRALILVCEHEEDQGAIGFIVNHPSEMTLRDLLEDMSIRPEVEQDMGQPIFLGGPVQPNLGFGLYSGKYEMEDSARIDSKIRVTTSRSLLEHCAVGKGPEQLLVTMGYAGWTPGQLEQELETGSWWMINPSPELMFGLPPEKRWGEAVNQLGLPASSLYFGSGHA